jgi:hypothetical protein
LAVRFALFEPRTTRRGPSSALEEQIGVLAELLRWSHSRSERFDVFDLAFGNDLKDVAGPLLDEGHEGSVAEWTVGAAEREGIGKCGDADAEIGCHAVRGTPEIAQVGAMGDEGEAGKPGCVKARGANDDIDFVVFAFMVYEACLGDGSDGVSEYGGVVGNECFEVTGRWRWTSAAWVEVLWNHLFDQTRIVVKFLSHLSVGIIASHASLIAALDDELEALIQLVFDLFAVLEIFLGVLLEKFELLVAVYEVSA